MVLVLVWCCLKNPNRVLACLKREAAKKHYTHGSVLQYYKRNAKTRGLSWELSLEEFDTLIKRECFYCGEPPETRILRRYIGGELRLTKLSYNGIDRADYKKGYTTDNCLSCCSRCNLGKLRMTPEEFINHAIKIARKAGCHDGNLVLE